MVGSILIYVGIILGFLVLGILLLVVGAMAQHHYYGKPELDEVRDARDRAWARADAAERRAAGLAVESGQRDQARKAWMVEHDKVFAELKALRAAHDAVRRYVESGQHALDAPDPRHKDAISAEVIDTRDPFYKQLGPIPTLDMTISGNLRIPKELFDAATVPSGSVAS